LHDVAVFDVSTRAHDAVTFVRNDGNGVAKQRTVVRRIEQDVSTNTLLEELFASLRMPDLIAQVGRVLRHTQNASAKRLKKYGRA